MRRFLVPEFLVLALTGLLIAGSVVHLGAAELPHPSLTPPACIPDAAR